MPRENVDLRLRDLRMLGIALNERSLTRTAELLGTTQPSISKILRRLRTHFGDPLFVRSGNEMHPTPKAIAIEGALRTLLETVDDLSLSTPTFDPATSTRAFKLLVSEVGMIVFLPALMKRVAEEGPNLMVNAVPIDSRSYESRLESGEADLALGAFPRPSLGLRRQRLYTTGYLAVVRSGHPELKALHTRSGFLAANHIVVTAPNLVHGAHRTAQQSMDMQIPPEKVMLRLPSFTAAAIVASQTNGVATLPTKFAEIIGRQLALCVFKPPVAFPAIEITQYWHERFHRDAGHRWLRGISFELFAGSAK